MILGINKKESNSITSQRTLLNEFIKEEKDLNFYDEYIDDGYSGTDFNRPAFQRLLKDIKKEKINCIIVKDLSRLGRNYIEVGKYIEQVFPIFNIRFISINDYIDSFKMPESTNTILLPFKNLVNDEYARDTSIKIKTALNGKKKKGEFVGAFTSYGYIKDKTNKHKLIVDESVKEIIKSIFNWYVNEGLGEIAICHKLNNLGVLNPTGHKRIELGQKYNNYMLQDNVYTWNPSTIRNILQNEVYIGNTIQGKRKTKSHKIHKIEKVPKEEWIRVENTHEAIIDKEIFEKVKEIKRNDIKISQNTKKLSIWAGILKCNECKRAMNKKSSTNSKGNKYEYYICSTYRKKSNKLCTKHTIKVEKLRKAVLTAINLHIDLLTNIDDLVNKIKESNSKNKIKEKFDSILSFKQNQICKISNLKRTLYEDWKNEDITRDEYLEYKEKYENDIKKLKEEISKIDNEIEKCENENSNEIIENLKNKKCFTELSRNMILELIECIYIHENGNITIKFKFKDELKDILSI